MKKRNLNAPEYAHLKLLAGWAVYFAMYFLTERLIPAEACHVIHSPLDDLIPFREEFVIFYVGWYALIIGSLGYFLLYSVDSFRKLQTYIIITQTLAVGVYILYPSCQNLRPEAYPRNNLLTDCVRILYAVDTNTNVFPSEHAIGSAAVWLAAVHAKRLRSPIRITLITVLTTLTCFATVFLKQHSILDVLAAVPICALGYCLFYRNHNHKTKSHSGSNVSNTKS